MGNLRTIAAAAAVTAAGILLGSQADAGPPLKVYQLEADSLGNMWRLNTDDGALMACWQVNYGNDISCAAASGPGGTMVNYILKAGRSGTMWRLNESTGDLLACRLTYAHVIQCQSRQ